MSENILRKGQTGESTTNPGHFGSKTHDDATVVLHWLETGNGPAWSPDAKLAQVQQETSDSLNYHVAIADGGMVVFDLRREEIDPEDTFHELVIRRDGDKVTATMYLTDVDLGEAYDPQPGEFGDEAYDWLGKHEDKVKSWLKDTYGAEDESDYGWDASKIGMTIDVTDIAGTTDPFGEELDQLPDGMVRVDTWSAFAQLYNTTEAEQLQIDIRTDGFYSKLREALSGVPA